MGSIHHTKAKINVEYYIDIDNNLSGFLDYLLCYNQAIIIIAAKKGDIDKGFNQLIAELVTLDLYEEKGITNWFYGAVSIGELWRFGILNRHEKSIYRRDLHTYRVPEDIEQIFTIIIGILTKN